MSPKLQRCFSLSQRPDSEALTALQALQAGQLQPIFPTNDPVTFLAGDALHRTSNNNPFIIH